MLCRIRPERIGLDSIIFPIQYSSIQAAMALARGKMEAEDIAGRVVPMIRKEAADPNASRVQLLGRTDGLPPL
jgi:hypothetical protein